MDPLSQGLIGAALAVSASRSKTVKSAAVCGAMGGLAPDLDILIKSQVDPLLFIEFHRHFTHSLFFIPIGGLIVGLCLRFLFRMTSISWWKIYMFSTLGFATHGFLDACTSYGTRLFWPVSDLRISWNVISIVDPIFTITLLMFLIFSVWKKSAKLMRIGLCLALLYLCFGYVQHHRVKGVVGNIASASGHVAQRVLLNPTIGNNFLWRTVYEFDGKYHVNAVYMPIFADHVVYEGVKVGVIDKETIFPELPSDSVQREDIRRFAYFSQDFIYIHPESNNMIADLRYGTLPTDDRSLWGIVVDVANPQAHVKYRNLRNFNEGNYTEFWRMLSGEK